MLSERLCEDVLSARQPGRSEDLWRALVVRLIALVFALQAIGLFAAAPRPHVEGPALAAMAAAPHCPHHAPSPAHDGKSDACPMCQALGCALAGAPPPVAVAHFRSAHIGALAAPVAQPAPKTAPRRNALARGPPLNA